MNERTEATASTTSGMAASGAQTSGRRNIAQKQAITRMANGTLTHMGQFSMSASLGDPR